MPGQFIAVPGTNTMEACYPGSPWRTDRHVNWREWWNYDRRNVKTAWRDPFFSQWPVRSGFISDPASPASGIMQNDALHNDGFEAPSYGPGGQQGQKFIMGQCLDSVGAPVSGAVVQGFLASNDTLVNETTADSSGLYELGTPYPATNHYLVAYRAGAPDIAGTTVNTLQGTNRDGT